MQYVLFIVLVIFEGMMNLKLQSVRIRNFRSIKSQDIDFGETTILFGKNDSGKSNVVKALELAFDRSRQVDVSNVHVSLNSPDARETIIVVDVRFVGNLATDSQWIMSFSEKPFVVRDDGEMSLSFRTEVMYNAESRTFEKTRSIINDWDNKDSGSTPLPMNLLDSIDFILLDAHRDIAETIRDRYSRWNQEVRKADMPDDAARAIESKLAELGGDIVKASPFLTAAQVNLKGSTDRFASKVEIAPVARSLNELYRSTDIIVTEDEGLGISVSSFGAGTRSRAEFMALKALIDIAARDAEKREIPYLCLAAFEEPEAHIHPQSQQQLLVELDKMAAQRIVTTHSPYILSKAPMDSLVYVRREGFVTTLTRMMIDLSDEQRKETERYLLRTRGELLFADVIILAEGETEEKALPIFFERRYKKELFEHGVTIVACGGSNYEPFIRIANRLGIPWLVFSDAEEGTLNSVKKQVSKALDLNELIDLDKYPRIVTCRPDNDYEAELIFDGYAQEMLKAIREYDDKHRDPTSKKRYVFNSWMKQTNGQRVKNGADGERYDFNGTEGEIRALSAYLDIDKNKTCYASPIAEEIASIDDDERCLPSCVKALFTELDKVLQS